MVGNSAQDLGQVAGVAGSAGVAVGQMAEYFADATLGAESFRSALTSMVAVAGPIAALAAVVEIISSAVQAFSDRNKTAADNTEMLTEAMREGGDAAENYADALASSGKVLADVGDNKGYRDIQKGLFGMLTQFGAVPFVVGQAGELLGLFGKKTEDVTKNLLDAGFTADTWAQAVAGGADAVAKTAAAMDANNISADEQDKILTALKGSQNDYTRATERAAIMNGFFGTEVDDAAEKLKASQKAYKETGDALEEWADRTTKAVEDASQAFIDLADAQTTLDDMGGVFEQMKLNSDALSLAFDLGNAPLEALERVTDVNDAIRDLGDFIKKEGKPNIFDPNDIDAGPFLAKIDSLRGPIQSAITDAFATGGPTAATATADAYVKQIVSSLHGKLTAGEVRTLLGLDDLQATLKIAVDEASKNEAVKILEVLTGLTGESPWTANIQLALDAGTLSADAAKILESEQLRKLGIDVPATLLDIPAKDKAAAKAEADRWAADPQHAVDLQSVLASPSVKALTDARNKGQADADLVPYDGQGPDVQRRRRHHRRRRWDRRRASPGDHQRPVSGDRPVVGPARHPGDVRGAHGADPAHPWHPRPAPVRLGWDRRWTDDAERHPQHRRRRQPLRHDARRGQGHQGRAASAGHPWLTPGSPSPTTCARCARSGCRRRGWPSRRRGSTCPASCTRPSCSVGGSGSTSASSRAPRR
jgi:hypothetical protein